jgi:2-dehydro-3-deoxygluconokinase
VTEVVTLGECLIALVAASSGPLAEVGAFERHVAGAEANVAIGLARLGHDVSFIGRVGADSLGTVVRRRLRAEGVAVGSLTTDPTAPTGILLRERRIVGPSEVVYRRAGSAGSRLTPDDVAAAAGSFAGARWLHVTGITPALSPTAREAVETAIGLARTNGLTVSLDLNMRRRLWGEAEAAAVLGAIVPRCDVVLGSVDEVMLVTDVPADVDPGLAARALVDRGAGTAVLKLGAAGSLSLERGGPLVRRPGVPVAVAVDPVGAGDAFTAAWIAARLEGRSAEAALERGNASGAACVAAVGDVTGLPTTDELDRLVSPEGGDTIR